jgi:predicted AlkP superfamily pyrophosphatase or phosphodiesterase
MKTLQYVLFPLMLIVVLSGCAGAQVPVKGKDQETIRRPKLIIGITVDQMRYDYIERYWDDYSAGGFKRMVGDGFFCRNLHYNYMPTYTGPGHASIFTGTTPAYHGIIQNDWYERSSGKMIYCSSDSTATGVGTLSVAGKMSPYHLRAETIGDAMELFFNDRSKVIGIAMKDRGAILPAGRTADAAYWFVGGNEGVWSSSSWYMSSLPPWVEAFNKSGKAEEYVTQKWTLLKDESVYDESNADNNAHEAPFKGMLKPVFPYDLPSLRATNGNYDLIKGTPFGNEMTVDFAKAVIENEQMGTDQYADMLCMSFSATDYIGHQFGMHAVETQDCYLRLDLLLSEFLGYLDGSIGKENYLVFLTADHGGAPTPSFTLKSKAAAGYWKSDSLEIFVENGLKAIYGEGDWVINESNQNIFLNRDLITAKKLDLAKMQSEVVNLTLKFPEVLMSFTSDDLSKFNNGILTKEMIRNGFVQSMSGDVIYTLKPGYIEYGMMGTTHGSPYVYDSHVPAIFYGFGVQPGETYLPYTITDIAPTVAAIARLPLPDACTGIPVVEAIRPKR